MTGGNTSNSDQRNPKLSKRTVDRLSVNGKDAVFWDRDLPGFGIRVYPSGVKVYVVQTRRAGRSKRVALGRHGETSPELARREAARLLAGMKTGESPPAGKPDAEPTVSDLARRYLQEYVAMHNKPATGSHYRIMLRKHIVPALGNLPVAAVERKHIMSMHYELHDTPAVANRAVEILLKMFNLAELWEMRPPGRNPCKSIPRYKINRRKERFLSPEELGRLGRTLAVASSKRLASSHAAAAIRLLVLTGCRRNEILGLRWEDVNFKAGELRLADSKTGARILPLPPAAAEVLEKLSELPCEPDNPWVFPGRKRGTRLTNINDSWIRIRRHAGLDGVRLHDLRHTYASRALAIGEGLRMIGELLGHRKISTTERYSHLAREPVRASTAKVAESIGADILDFPETPGSLDQRHREAHGGVDNPKTGAAR